MPPELRSASLLALFTLVGGTAVIKATRLHVGVEEAKDGWWRGAAMMSPACRVAQNSPGNRPRSCTLKQANLARMLGIWVYGADNAWNMAGYDTGIARKQERKAGTH
ncbi:predicted protein [Pyrenophora tritici-repentis Pt-1C-BFP]|uniref:Uncharacterized protein n=1 Tax=Pyrenophora tritici-repentis (strain Pt-1C-BFP) TaxID=426418 RepID=B2WE25_PYRTR|nr:uncharacterized protein PTRG_08398 [Pyrenophora tritici-repentis Pt-1C-BFP]EDU51317.1 predicted protein [Pyrenophora tritici-repentis Pt-1C-BFP]